MKIILSLLLVPFLFTPLKAQTLTKQDFLPPSNFEYQFNTENISGFKSKTLARTISVSATLASYYLMAVLVSNDSHSVPAYLLASAFLITAPSAGFLYIANSEEFWYGSGRRLAATGMILTGMGIAALINSLDIQNYDYEPDALATTGLILIGGGLVYFLWSSVKDIIDVKEETVRYNRNLLRRTNISPSIDPGTLSVGLSLKINF